MAKTGGRTVLGTISLVSLVGLFARGPARAEHHAYENRTFDRSPAEGFPGAVIHVRGTGCIENGKPYQEADVLLGNGTFASGFQRYKVRPDGTWGGEYTISAQAPPGDYRLNADCIADDMVFPIGYQNFRVLDPSPPTSAPSTTAASPTSSVATTQPPTSRPTSRVAGPKGVTSSSSTPTTTTPTSPPSQPLADTPSSVPAVAAEEPKRRSRDDDTAAYVGAVVILLTAAAAAAWRVRRRRT